MAAQILHHDGAIGESDGRHSRGIERDQRAQALITSAVKATSLTCASDAGVDPRAFVPRVFISLQERHEVAARTHLLQDVRLLHRCSPP